MTQFAISVPDKVFSDIHLCQVGIIHVAQDQIIYDKDGNEVYKINKNVLIEIGAAIALYGKRCKKFLIKTILKDNITYFTKTKAAVIILVTGNIGLKPMLAPIA